MAAPSATNEPSEPAMEGMEKRPPADTLSSLQSLLVTVVIAVFVITFIVQAFQIPSESMENTLLIGDYLLVDKLRYGGGGAVGPVHAVPAVHRGDIIVFRYPVHPTQHFVKRVVGVPGDRVRLINRQVYVNGHPLQEPYARYSSGDARRLPRRVPAAGPSRSRPGRRLVAGDEETGRGRRTDHSAGKLFCAGR